MGLVWCRLVGEFRVLGVKGFLGFRVKGLGFLGFGFRCRGRLLGTGLSSASCGYSRDRI